MTALPPLRVTLEFFPTIMRNYWMDFVFVDSHDHFSQNKTWFCHLWSLNPVGGGKMRSRDHFSEWETEGISEKNYHVMGKHCMQIGSSNDWAGPNFQSFYRIQFTGWETFVRWMFMHTQGLYVTIALRGAFIGVGLSFIVILLATWDIIQTQEMKIGISYPEIVCNRMLCGDHNRVHSGNCVGTVECLWVSIRNYWNQCSLRALWILVESICVTILAGFSVDYVVHLAHAYDLQSWYI